VIELGDHVPRGQLRVVEHLRHVADGTRGDAVLIEPIEGVLRRQIGERGVEFGVERVPVAHALLVGPEPVVGQQVGAVERLTEPRPERVGRAGDDDVPVARLERLIRSDVRVFAPHPSRRLAAREVVRRHVAGPCSLPVEQAHVDLLARPVAEFAF